MHILIVCEESQVVCTAFREKGLPLLRPTDIVEPEKIHSKGRTGGYSGNSWFVRDENGKILSWGDPRTARARSRTYEGIARAMAYQWGNLV